MAAKKKKKFPTKIKRRSSVITTGKRSKSRLKRKRSGITTTGKRTGATKKRGRIVTTRTHTS